MHKQQFLERDIVLLNTGYTDGTTAVFESSNFSRFVYRKWRWIDEPSYIVSGCPPRCFCCSQLRSLFIAGTGVQWSANCSAIYCHKPLWSRATAAPSLVRLLGG